jgi:hypothetical protein
VREPRSQPVNNWGNIPTIPRLNFQTPSFVPRALRYNQKCMVARDGYLLQSNEHISILVFMDGRTKTYLWVHFLKILVFHFVKIQSITFPIIHRWPKSNIISWSSDAPNMTAIAPFLKASKRRSRDIRIKKRDRCVSRILYST